MLRALAQPNATGHRLWVAGRDRIASWQRLAERLGVADRIRFLGERRDVESLYHAVDAMVLPTRYDPFANVTLEAAAAGLPIVTSQANGAGEWLGDAIRRVAGPEDVQDLSRALAEFSCPARRRDAGRRLAERAAGLGWDRHVEQLREGYRRILATRTSGGTR